MERAGSRCRRLGSCRHRVAHLFSISPSPATQSIGLRPGHPRRHSERVSSGRTGHGFTLTNTLSGICGGHRAGVGLRWRGGARPSSRPNHALLAVSPDGATLLVADEVGTALNGPLWAVPVLGGSPRRLGEAVGRAAAWSPDGQMIVYANGHDLFLAKSDGAEPHKLVSAPDRVLDLAWSPDGTVIRFSVGMCTTIRFGRFRSTGRACIPCFPPGTLLPTNVAANGLPTGNISFSSQKAISGPLLRRGIYLEKPTANPCN